MNSAIRDRLRLTVSIALSLLPRWAKHDFWRIVEPQHQRAHDAIVEAVLSRIDDEFEIALKERPESSSYRRVPS